MDWPASCSHRVHIVQILVRDASFSHGFKTCKAEKEGEAEAEEEEEQEEDE